MKTKLFGLFISSVFAFSPFAAEFWVSPDGDDSNIGTREKPFSSVATALRKARELRRLAKVDTNEPVRIVLRGGIYPLTSPLLVRLGRFRNKIEPHHRRSRNK